MSLESVRYQVLGFQWMVIIIILGHVRSVNKRRCSTVPAKDPVIISLDMFHYRSLYYQLYISMYFIYWFSSVLSFCARFCWHRVFRGKNSRRTPACRVREWYHRHRVSVISAVEYRLVVMEHIMAVCRSSRWLWVLYQISMMEQAVFLNIIHCELTRYFEIVFAVLIWWSIQIN